MSERKGLSKKTRFQVFKRDQFTCCYCGRCPPNVVLEVDHIIAVANGGTNQIDNLISSCFDCNRGKGAEHLELVPPSITEKIAIQQEKLDQIKALDRLLKQQKKLESAKIDEVEAVFNSYHSSRQFTDNYRRSVSKFINELGVGFCIDAMESACLRTKNSSDATKYFCGICWKVIKERSNG